MIPFFRSDYDKLMPDSDADERHYLLHDFSLRNAHFSNTVQWPSFVTWILFVPAVFIGASFSESFSIMPVRVFVMTLPTALSLLLGYGLHRFTWPHNRKKFKRYLKDSPTSLPK